MMPSQFNRQQRYTCPFSMALLMILLQGLVTASSASQSCLNGPTLFVVIRQRKFPKQQIQSGSQISQNLYYLFAFRRFQVFKINLMENFIITKQSLKSIANMAGRVSGEDIFYLWFFSQYTEEFVLAILWWSLATYFYLN